MAETEVKMLNGRTIADVKARQRAEEAMQAVSELSTVEMVATLEDGTSATYQLFGEKVAE